MAVQIHPTALVDPRARLADGVAVGPFCVVEAGAILGPNTRLIGHVTIAGQVRMGADNVVHPYCVLGGEPQDHSYRGEPTWVEIGDRNIFREGVTVHRGTQKEDGYTRVGDDNFLMAGCHVAHDVTLGSHVTMANSTLLSGHVHVQDYAALSGLIGVHHFATIGSYAFVGGMSRISMDVPPFMLVEGNPAEVRCVNLVGLRRRGFSAVEIRSLTEAHRLLYRLKVPAEKAREVLADQELETAPVQKLFDFLDEQRQGRHGRGRERLRAA